MLGKNTTSPVSLCSCVHADMYVRVSKPCLIANTKNRGRCHGLSREGGAGVRGIQRKGVCVRVCKSLHIRVHACAVGHSGIHRSFHSVQNDVLIAFWLALSPPPFFPLFVWTTLRRLSEPQRSSDGRHLPSFPAAASPSPFHSTSLPPPIIGCVRRQPRSDTTPPRPLFFVIILLCCVRVFPYSHSYVSSPFPQ